MKNIIWFLFFIIVLCGTPCLFAQMSILKENNSVLKKDINLFVNDTISISRSLIQSFSPNPTKAIIYSSFFPGLGQIYNRKYWKLPIIYGGFLGCVYAVIWNNSFYNEYKNCIYFESWKFYKFLEEKNDISKWSINQKEKFINNLKIKKDYYRRYRDLSYIVTIGWHVLFIIDSYVDAQLFNFDISENLSLKMKSFFFTKKNNIFCISTQFNY